MGPDSRQKEISSNRVSERDYSLGLGLFHFFVDHSKMTFSEAVEELHSSDGIILLFLYYHKRNCITKAEDYERKCHSEVGLKSQNTLTLFKD